MVHRAEHAADRVEDDVHVDDPQGDPLTHHAEHDEDVRVHDGGEQLEEVLDPQVDDPEAPVLGDGDLRRRAGEHAHRVEGRDRQGREEEDPGQIAVRLGPEPTPDGTHDDEDPQEHAPGQRRLEDPRQVQVLPLLAEQRPLGPGDAVAREHLAAQGAEHDDGHGDEEHAHPSALVPGLAARDEGREEDAAGQEGRRHAGFYR